ncbi:hypothetical protein [Methylosarcina fibrata]|uniref:hypothetical protein n=1 Tax=Methylosarcina fibrata TaxID=105972 RepID=UPI000380B6A2|nr:hypothetical protein [Methylosarcina fibrata]
MTIIIFIISAFISLKILGAIVRKVQRDSRRKFLVKKYENAHIAEKILDGYIWQGQTSEQLFDSRGGPNDIERKVLKSKTKETWKYHQVRKGQFRIRIFLENDIVVGWEEK